MLKSRLLSCLAVFTAIFSLMAGVAAAHEHVKRCKGEGHTSGMERQHALMADYAAAQTNIETALAKGDAQRVVAEARKVLATIKDMKAGVPHKNMNNLKAFKVIASGFESEMKTTARLAGLGDLAGARAAFRRAEAKCVVCHGKFRD